MRGSPWVSHLSFTYTILRVSDFLQRMRPYHQAEYMEVEEASSEGNTRCWKPSCCPSVDRCKSFYNDYLRQLVDLSLRLSIPILGATYYLILINKGLGGPKLYVSLAIDLSLTTLWSVFAICLACDRRINCKEKFEALNKADNDVAVDPKYQTIDLSVTIIQLCVMGSESTPAGWYAIAHFDRSVLERVRLAGFFFAKLVLFVAQQIWIIIGYLKPSRHMSIPERKACKLDFPLCPERSGSTEKTLVRYVDKLGQIVLLLSISLVLLYLPQLQFEHTMPPPPTLKLKNDSSWQSMHYYGNPVMTSIRMQLDISWKKYALLNTEARTADQVPELSVGFPPAKDVIYMDYVGGNSSSVTVGFGLQGINESALIARVPKHLGEGPGYVKVNGDLEFSVVYVRGQVEHIVSPVASVDYVYVTGSETRGFSGVSYYKFVNFPQPANDDEGSPTLEATLMGRKVRSISRVPLNFTQTQYVWCVAGLVWLMLTHILYTWVFPFPHMSFSLQSFWATTCCSMCYGNPRGHVPGLTVITAVIPVFGIMIPGIMRWQYNSPWIDLMENTQGSVDRNDDSPTFNSNGLCNGMYPCEVVNKLAMAVAIVTAFALFLLIFKMWLVRGMSIGLRVFDGTYAVRLKRKTGNILSRSRGDTLLQGDVLMEPGEPDQYVLLTESAGSFQPSSL